MEIALTSLAYLAIGIIAGILSGLLGIGGGVITVPCLLWIFHLLGYSQAFIMQMAIATSLAAMILTTAGSTWAHHRRHGVLWHVLKKMVPGLVVGSLVGALLGIWLSGVILEIFFGIFLCTLAIRFYFQKHQAIGSHQLPSAPVLSLLSGCIGALSNLLGIGGGSLTVPMLTHFKVADKNAIGTSAATTLITSILGSISYAFFAWKESPDSDTFGLINIPAFLIIGTATFFIAPYGAKLAHELSPIKVRKLFAFILLLTGISLML